MTLDQIPPLELKVNNLITLYFPILRIKNVCREELWM
jgi:hypothetical protein